MSVTSGISRLQELQARRRSSAGREKALTEKTQKLFRVGFGLICLLALVGIAMPAVIRRGDMSTVWAYSVGIESFSLVVSAII